MDIISILVIYAIIVNIAGFSIMGIDKKRAVRHAYRVPESTLFTVALIGGSPGAILGMYTFRHKTRHWSFVAGLPAILFIQILVIILTAHYIPVVLSSM